MAKTTEYRNQNIAELEANIFDNTEKLYKLRNQQIVEKTLEKPHQKKLLRRDIARLKTIIQEKNKQVKNKG